MNTPLSIIGALSPNRQSNPTLRSLRSLRCYRTRLTADKREIKDFPKLSSATSYIHKTLNEMLKPVRYANYNRR